MKTALRLWLTSTGQYNRLPAYSKFLLVFCKQSHQRLEPNLVVVRKFLGIWMAMIILCWELGHPQERFFLFCQDAPTKILFCHDQKLLKRTLDK